MTAIIVNSHTRDVMFELKSDEYSTFYHALVNAFDRFEIPIEDAKTWVNAYPQRHITIDGHMSKYEAILI